MSTSSASATSVSSAFTCGCDEKFRSACQDLPFYKNHSNKPYCVLHLPDASKAADFGVVLQQKIEAKDFDFGGAWFPKEHSFRSFNFERAAIFQGAFFNAPMNFTHSVFEMRADFDGAVFNGDTSFKHSTFHGEVYFSKAKFESKADLSWNTFEKAVYFTRTTFMGVAGFMHSAFHEEAHFTETVFNAATDFYSAVFHTEVRFFAPSFEGMVNFRGASFKDYFRISVPQHGKVFGQDAWLDLQFAKVEKPGHISFNTVTLRPHWFVNVDARAFDFMDVRWQINVAKELAALKQRVVHPAHSLLAITYRRLARNAEENERYDEASTFRYLSMDIRRQEKWEGFAFWKLNWWYWAASGYGERIIRASLILLAVWFIFALLYTCVGFTRWQPKATNEQEAATMREDEFGQPFALPRSLMYSLGVLTLQKPEPPPATPAAEVLVTLETILGPLQAALLALAIRRKFMR